MELIDTSVPAKNQHLGHERMDIPGGKFLKIEISPNGEEILNYQIPEGPGVEALIHIELVEKS